MIGLGLSLTSIPTARRPWTPAVLLPPETPGIWVDPSRLDLLAQDAAGSVPMTGPGQPVGLARRRAGTVDAPQPVALSRPTLARWPRGGRRNLATGAQAVGDAAYWPEAVTSNGITAAKIATGVEDGVPYVDVRYQGLAAGTQHAGAYIISNSNAPAASGEVFTARVTARVIAGSAPGGVAIPGIRINIEERNASGVWVAGGGSAVGATSAEDTTVTLTRALTDATAASAQTVVTLGFTSGAVVDVTYRLKALQFEAGATASPLQHNLGPHDVTEPGVPDVWHLWDDGGDSLPVALPAGVYGRAWVDHLGVVTVDAVTAPANALLAARQAGAILRAGAFSAAEEAAIRKYWARVAA
ncbi:hypothetical protein [Pseudogemmobacter sonorensis]|uniref:hypothetical protein n=1 Tax=Pseudogemmobacter sonorensis TaxID=2989681 RepID=UPI0036B7F941